MTKYKFKTKKLLNGFSYLEIIISMVLISVFILGTINIFAIARKKYNFAYENYFADVTLDNLFNVAKSEFDLKNSILNIDCEQKCFYPDKFNFVIRLNQFDSDLCLQNECKILNPSHENILPLEITLQTDSKNLFPHEHENYLLTIDLFDKKHKFLKRMTNLLLK